MFALLCRADTQVCPYSPAQKKELLSVEKFLRNHIFAQFPVVFDTPCLNLQTKKNMDLIIAGGCLLIMLIAIYILAIMTDEYFIPSLDHISHQLNLPHNVAGASLMAMGSSAPELAIALTALFQGGGEHSDVGIGTIVGSAVFIISWSLPGLQHWPAQRRSPFPSSPGIAWSM
ncbi:MAG: hypothetical protein D3903_15460 [Candidatus Electrothrix sp. GM3_4]|nr:hypothetical protein [Candidatus Electrothrix sp. GM3_4]